MSAEPKGCADGSGVSSAAANSCWINRGGFALVEGKTHMTGAQIRALPMPSIRDDDDLYMEVPGDEDVLVRFDEVVPVVGRRFFSVPRIINAGASSTAPLKDHGYHLPWEVVCDAADRHRGIARVLDSWDRLVCEANQDCAELIVAAVNGWRDVFGD